MPQFTSYDIIAASVAGLIGFAFRLGITYEREHKLPARVKMVFMAFFSFGCGALMQLWVFHKAWDYAIGLIMTTAASFFGPAIVTGAGNIDASFFTKLIKDMLRKWVNNDNTNTQYDDSTEEEEHMEQ